MTNWAVLSSIIFLHQALNPEHKRDAGQVSMLTQRTGTAQRRMEQLDAGGEVGSTSASPRKRHSD